MKKKDQKTWREIFREFLLLFSFLSLIGAVYGVILWSTGSLPDGTSKESKDAAYNKRVEQAADTAIFIEALQN